MPDQLISIQSLLILPLSPSSRAALRRGQIPTFFSRPLLDIKCLSVLSLVPSPPHTHLRSLFTRLANRRQCSVICSPYRGYCRWQREVAQQCAPLVDKPFEIRRLWRANHSPFPLGASQHQSSFVSGPSV